MLDSGTSIHFTVEELISSTVATELGETAHYNGLDPASAGIWLWLWEGKPLTEAFNTKVKIQESRDGCFNWNNSLFDALSDYYTPD